ncbi:calcium/sodium antiporter [bacterium]|nr:calcium/sodium antiporter [bacterium]
MYSDLGKEILFFAISLFVLIKSADYLVKYSEKLGLSLGIPQFIIGITLISAGTSLPELATSIFSVLKGQPGVVAGNVVGSNIANILLVVGITTILVKRVEIKRSLIRLDLPLLVASGAVLVLTLSDGKFTFFEALVSLAGFVIYLIYSITQPKQDVIEKGKEFEEVTLDNNKKTFLQKRPPFKWSYIVWVIGSAAVLYFSADFTIDSVISLGTLLSVDTSIIAITAVAIGTSLPELMVSVVAAKKGNFDIALGNILGSNIFNGFLVMGVSGLISDLPVETPVLLIGIPFFIVATILLVFSGIERKFYNFEGAFFLILYLLFIEQLYQMIVV